jgi:hypothetical protein
VRTTLTHDKLINKFISDYEQTIRKMWGVTHGGRLRSLKGTLVENMAEEIARHAWAHIGGKPGRLTIDKKRYAVDDDKKNTYRISQDKQVYVDGKFVLSIECKAYAEVAMYKRILVDALLIKKRFPELQFCLFQLESMLGGDYSTDPAHPKGSPSVKVLEYYFPHLDIEIITLLDGERKIDEPIHQKRFYKSMQEDRVKYAINYFETVLKKYV